MTLAGLPGARAAPAAPPDERLHRRRSWLAAASAAASAIVAFLAIAVLYLISAHLLYRLGVSYETTSGSLVEKIHPGTWLACAAFAMGTLRHGAPFAYLDRIPARFPGLAIFFVAWLLVFVYTAVVRGLPLTPLIDSFVLPMVLLPLLTDLSPAARRRIALLLHAVMLANALIGLYEFGTGFRLTPYVEQGIVITDDWRSTALLGHPLINAAGTGVYVLVLAVGGGRDVPALVRPVLLAVQVAALFAFGGRVATIGCGLLLAWLLAVATVRFAFGRRIGLARMAILIGAIPAVLGAIAWLVQTGFFDRFADRFIADKGSAEARVIILQLLGETSWPDLILGGNVDRITTFLYQQGIEFGIESFWVNFALLYGLGVGLFFFAGLVCFCRELVRATRRGTTLVLVLLFAVASTSVSISAKSTLFGMIVAMLLVMLGKNPSIRLRPTPRSRAELSRNGEIASF